MENAASAPRKRLPAPANRDCFGRCTRCCLSIKTKSGVTNGDGLVDRMLDFGSRIENLDLEDFRQCLVDRRTLDRLKKADEEQRSRGITAQPIFEIGELRLVGLQSFERMSEVIEAASK
jgi:hypothetical protein